MRTHATTPEEIGAQGKARVSRPQDAAELEADRIAEAVVSGEVAGGVRVAETPMVQRACCEGCADCEEEDELVQRRAADTASLGAPPPLEGLAGRGTALSPSLRSFFEPRLGHDFGGVRIHEDARAADLATALHARAFTRGHDVVFGAGEFAPDSREGRRLLAHELAHVVQQERGAEERIARAPETSESQAGVLIVEDGSAALAPGQMHKSELLRQLRAAVVDTVSQAVGPFWSVADCPWIEHWFSYYETRDARHGERALRRYVGNVPVTSAAEFVPLVCARVRGAADRWSSTGELGGLPELAAGGDAEDERAGREPVQFKNESGVSAPAHPGAVRAQLGRGAPLDGGTRQRMEAALGGSFGDVRVHTDERAASLSRRHQAHAFTVGSDVAFAPGAYRPGAPAGDALLAHELAHVLQQRQGGGAMAQAVDSPSLESDADQAAASALAALWLGARPSTTPRLGSGLRLSRCGGGRSRQHTNIPESTSPFGAFDVEHALDVTPTATQGGSYYIKITFHPNARTDGCASINFVQAVRRGTAAGWSVNAGDPGVDAERAARNTPSGWRLDVTSAQDMRNVYYTQQLDATGAHVNVADWGASGSHGGGNPWMMDTPGLSFPSTKLEFITCAVCQTAAAGHAAEQERSFGCVQWGCDFDDSRSPKVIEETPSFAIQNPWAFAADRVRMPAEARDRWNTNVATGGGPAVMIENAPAMRGLEGATLAGSGVEFLRIEDPHDRTRLILSGSQVRGAFPMVTTLLVLTHTVRRADHDGTVTDMTEVLFGGTRGWMPTNLLNFVPAP